MDNHIKVQTDTTNGIYQVISFESHVDVVDQNMFCQCLDDLGDEVIGTKLDKYTQKILETEYGISYRALLTQLKGEKE